MAPHAGEIGIPTTVPLQAAVHPPPAMPANEEQRTVHSTCSERFARRRSCPRSRPWTGSVECSAEPERCVLFSAAALPAAAVPRGIAPIAIPTRVRKPRRSRLRLLSLMLERASHASVHPPPSSTASLTLSTASRLSSFDIAIHRLSCFACSYWAIHVSHRDT